MPHVFSCHHSKKTFCHKFHSWILSFMYWFNMLLIQTKYQKYKALSFMQSYEIKSPPWTILWFRILGIFSVENIKRLCVFMFQTWDNSQLLRRVLWISAELTIVSSLKHKNTQPLYIFNRVRVLHLDRLKEGTWLHSFALHQVVHWKKIILFCVVIQF